MDRAAPNGKVSVRDGLPLLIFAATAVLIGAAGVVKAAAEGRWFVWALAMLLSSGGGYVFVAVLRTIHYLNRSLATESEAALNVLAARRVRSAIRRDADVAAGDVLAARTYLAHAVWPWWKIAVPSGSAVLLAFAEAGHLSSHEAAASAYLIAVDAVLLLASVWILAHQYTLRAWARRHHIRLGRDST